MTVLGDLRAASGGCRRRSRMSSESSRADGRADRRQVPGRISHRRDTPRPAGYVRSCCLILRGLRALRGARGLRGWYDVADLSCIRVGDPRLTRPAHGRSRSGAHDGSRVRASVPSGASTGSHEAIELRDGDSLPFRWGRRALSVRHVRNAIARAGARPEPLDSADRRPPDGARRDRRQLGARGQCAPRRFHGHGSCRGVSDGVSLWHISAAADAPAADGEHHQRRPSCGEGDRFQDFLSFPSAPDSIRRPSSGGRVSRAPRARSSSWVAFDSEGRRRRLRPALADTSPRWLSCTRP